MAFVAQDPSVGTVESVSISFQKLIVSERLITPRTCVQSARFEVRHTALKSHPLSKLLSQNHREVKPCKNMPISKIENDIENEARISHEPVCSDHP